MDESKEIITLSEFAVLTKDDKFKEYELLSGIYKVILDESFIKVMVQKQIDDETGKEKVVCAYLDSSYQSQLHYRKLFAYVGFIICVRVNGGKYFEEVSYDQK